MSVRTPSKRHGDSLRSSMDEAAAGRSPRRVGLGLTIPLSSPSASTSHPTPSHNTTVTAEEMKRLRARVAQRRELGHVPGDEMNGVDASRSQSMLTVESFDTPSAASGRYQSRLTSTTTTLRQEYNAPLPSPSPSPLNHTTSSVLSTSTLQVPRISPTSSTSTSTAMQSVHTALELESLRTRNVELANQIDAKDISIHILQERVQVLETSLLSSNTQIEQARSVRLDLESRLSNAEEKEIEHANAQDRMKIQLDKLGQDKRALENELSKLQQENLYLSSLLEETRTKLLSITTTQSELKIQHGVQVNELNEIITKLQTELEQVKDTLTFKIQDIESLQAQHANFVKESQQALRGEQEKLHESTLELNRVQSVLQTEQQRRLQQEQIMIEREDSLKRGLQQSETRVRERDEQLRDKESQMQAFENLFKQAQQELDQAQRELNKREQASKAAFRKLQEQSDRDAKVAAEQLQASQERLAKAEESLKKLNDDLAKERQAMNEKNEERWQRLSQDLHSLLQRAEAATERENKQRAEIERLLRELTTSQAEQARLQSLLNEAQSRSFAPAHAPPASPAPAPAAAPAPTFDPRLKAQDLDAIQQQFLHGLQQHQQGLSSKGDLQELQQQFESLRGVLLQAVHGLEQKQDHSFGLLLAQGGHLPKIQTKLDDMTTALGKDLHDAQTHRISLAEELCQQIVTGGLASEQRLLSKTNSVIERVNSAQAEQIELIQGGFMKQGQQSDRLIQGQGQVLERVLQGQSQVLERVLQGQSTSIEKVLQVQAASTEKILQSHSTITKQLVDKQAEEMESLIRETTKRTEESQKKFAQQLDASTNVLNEAISNSNIEPTKRVLSALDASTTLLNDSIQSTPVESTKRILSVLDSTKNDLVEATLSALQATLNGQGEGQKKILSALETSKAALGEAIGNAQVESNKKILSAVETTKLALGETIANVQAESNKKIAGAIDASADATVDRLAASNTESTKRVLQGVESAKAEVISSIQTSQAESIKRILLALESAKQDLIDTHTTELHTGFNTQEKKHLAANEAVQTLIQQVGEHVTSANKQSVSQAEKKILGALGDFTVSSSGVVAPLDPSVKREVLQLDDLRSSMSEILDLVSVNPKAVQQLLQQTEKRVLAGLEDLGSQHTQQQVSSEKKILSGLDESLRIATEKSAQFQHVQSTERKLLDALQQLDASISAQRESTEKLATVTQVSQVEKRLGGVLNSIQEHLQNKDGNEIVENHISSSNKDSSTAFESQVLDSLSRISTFQTEQDEVLRIFEKYFAQLQEGGEQTLRVLGEMQQQQQQQQGDLATLIEQSSQEILRTIDHSLPQVKVDTDTLEELVKRLGERADQLSALQQKPEPADASSSGSSASAPSEPQEDDDRALSSAAVVVENLWSLLRRVVSDSVIANTLPSGQPRENPSWVIHPQDRQQFMELIGMLPTHTRAHALALMKVFGRKGDRAVPKIMLSEAVADVHDAIGRYRTGTPSRCNSRQLMFGLFALLFVGVTSGIVLLPSCGGPSAEALADAGIVNNGYGNVWGLHS